MKLYDFLKDGFMTEGEYNCSERMLYGANRAYNLGLSDESMKVSAGFGGGMGVQGVCGAVTGAVMVLSFMFVRDHAHEGDLIGKLCAELIGRVEESLSSCSCKELRPLYRTENEKCAHIIYECARILDDIALREKKHAVRGSI